MLLEKITALQAKECADRCIEKRGGLALALLDLKRRRRAKTPARRELQARAREYVFWAVQFLLDIIKRNPVPAGGRLFLVSLPANPNNDKPGACLKAAAHLFALAVEKKLREVLREEGLDMDMAGAVLRLIWTRGNVNPSALPALKLRGSDRVVLVTEVYGGRHDVERCVKALGLHNKPDNILSVLAAFCTNRARLQGIRLTLPYVKELELVAALPEVDEIVKLTRANMEELKWTWMLDSLFIPLEYVVAIVRCIPRYWDLLQAGCSPDPMQKAAAERYEAPSPIATYTRTLVDTEQGDVDAFNDSFCVYVHTIVTWTLRASILPRLLLLEDVAAAGVAWEAHEAMVEQLRALTVKAEEAVEGVDPQDGMAVGLDRADLVAHAREVYSQLEEAEEEGLLEVVDCVKAQARVGIFSRNNATTRKRSNLEKPGTDSQTDRFTRCVIEATSELPPAHRIDSDMIVLESERDLRTI